MDLKDFEGVYKWKFLVPSVYMINWAFIPIGTIFFPYAYQIISMIVIVYSVLKTLGLCLGTLVSLIKFKSSLKQIIVLSLMMQAVQSSNQDLQNPNYHAIVIPSYKEDQDVLLETLNTLAQSNRAKRQFIVFLAMQAHEENSDGKARSIISKCKQKFLHMDFTQHKMRPGEAKGKAANVSWCVQQFEKNLSTILIDLNQVMITILDADSWAPKQYFQALQLKIKQLPERKHICVYSAPQIYTRNHLQVPVFNRTYDTMHSLAQLSNLVAVKFSFPLSNYSLSYNLAKRIGWWDTCPDAIGEDFHTCQKCFWKVQGEMYTAAIYIPFNQMSLSTGEGYCKDLSARFWQAERHTLGVNDVAYCCNMLFKTPFKFRNLWLTVLVIQIYTMAAVIPWALLGLSLQYKILTDTTIHYFPGWLIEILLNAATFFTFFSYIFYQWWRRCANSQIYGKKNDAWWRVFQYPIFFTFALFGFSIPSFIMASFAVLCTTTQYRVAQKHLDKNTPQNSKNVIKSKSVQKKNSLLKVNSLKAQNKSSSNKVTNQFTSDQSEQKQNRVQKSYSQLVQKNKTSQQNQPQNSSQLQSLQSDKIQTKNKGQNKTSKNQSPEETQGNDNGSQHDSED